MTVRGCTAEAYSASFDGVNAINIKGGDRMAVTFGAGAVLRSARFGPAGLTPPQTPAALPPPPPPPPPVPITNKWFAGEVNRSYDYGDCGGNAPGGCAVSPLLGITDSFEECQQLCLTTNITRCTSCGWIPNLQQVRDT